LPLKFLSQQLMMTDEEEQSVDRMDEEIDKIFDFITDEEDLPGPKPGPGDDDDERGGSGGGFAYTPAPISTF
jgi:hypothetical protein